MVEKHFKVEVEGDHIQKLSTAKPIPALAELIWNAVDADATRVEFNVEWDEIVMRAVTVRDNGHGIPHENVEELFGKLGGSWKRRESHSKLKGRILHGKEGKGRFKALALGRVADWIVRYRDSNKLIQYKITILKDDLTDVRITEPEEVSSALGSGVEVRVSELDRNFQSLDRDPASQSLSQIFALYLTDYSDVEIFIEDKKLDPSEAIAHRQSFELPPIDLEGKSHNVEVDLIEWKSSSERWIFFCGPEGFPFHRIKPRFQAPGFQFSAYIKSSYISALQENGLLDLIEMNAPLEETFEAASDLIKSYFSERESQAAQGEIEQWKIDHIYPYKEEPRNSIEKAERQVFEIVALNVKRHLSDFSEASQKSKAFQLRMLRQAIERGPEELQLILKEVLDLPDRKQKELARLLEDASLANVISASKLVADRLKFLNGLDALLFDPDTKKHLKERSQLHKMLADNNTWIFGEEFNLTVDDQSLTEVLRKHKKLIGSKTVIDKPVTRLDGKKGIVDLMLSRAVPQNHADEREHLVVELKRPSVTIGSNEISQVKNYAFAIAEDERFDTLKTRWCFWVISNALDKSGKRESRQSNRPQGQVYKDEDGKIEIWCKTWPQVLDEAKSRMHFVQEKLQANVDKETSLQYLKKTYRKYLTGVFEVSELPE